MASNTYTAVGNAQDISDIITNISPSDTPLYSRIGRTRATAVNHEWLEDDLGAPAANAQLEGFTFFTVDADPRTLLNNYTQIMERGVHVTGTQEVVLKHGVRSEMGYQMQKKLKELALDCERALIVQAAPVLGSMALARQFGGLPYWIITNVLDNGGTARALTFDLINSALEDTWNGGGKPSVLLVSPRNQRVISTFTAGNTKNISGTTTKLQQMIHVIETDFGMLQTLVDRYVPNDVVYGLSPEYIKKAFLRPFRQEDIAKVSDQLRKVVYGEWTLEMRAEKAHFAIQDLDGVVPVTP
jgi:hypothetical protein